MTVRQQDLGEAKIRHLKTRLMPLPMDSQLLSRVYRQATLLGIVAGLRSTAPIALLTWSSKNNGQDNGLAIPKTVTALATLGEIIADKLPATPSRVSPGPFIGRILIGAITGAWLSNRFKQPPLEGAIRGAIGGALGTLVGYAYRTFFAQTTNVPDVAWALIEDATAFGLGNLALRDPRSLENQE